MRTFKVVPARSAIELDLDVDLHPSHLRTSGLRGTLQCSFDRSRRPSLDAPYSAELALDVASLKSGNRLQDLEMRRRMDTGRFPEISASLMEATRNADGTYRATFSLTIRGRTRRVTGDATLAVGPGVLTIDGEQRINMRHFGIDPPRLLLLRVAEVMTVRAHIEAREQRS